MNRTNPADIVFSPQDISRLSTKNLESRRNARIEGNPLHWMPMYVKSLDMVNTDEKKFLPVLPTELITVIARPGHGKTALMMYWARKRANEIRLRAAMGDTEAARRVVAYVTYEQPIEELNAFHVAATLGEKENLSVTAMAMGHITDSQWAEVQRINMQRIADPLWFIGHSIERRAARPVIDAQALQDALLAIETWQGEKSLIVDSIFIDYLQLIPYARVESKTIGISDNLNALKNTFRYTGARGIVGVQATREVEKRDDPTPLMADGQWTSNIEQDSDGVISLLRPCQYKAQGESFQGMAINGYQQMKIAILKRKLGPANFAAWVAFDTKYNRLNDAEVKTYDFSQDA
jgi:replicative DNA helicase